jgi:hypothetical protein
MKNYFLTSLAAGLLLLLQAAPAAAEIRFIKTSSGTTLCDTKSSCSSLSASKVPMTQGSSVSYTVIGPWVDWTTGPSITGSGVIVTKTSGRVVKVYGEDMGEIVLRFDVRNDASTGERTVSIGYVNLGADSFKVKVIGAGKVTGGETNINLPNYFQEAEVTLTGENIGNADALVSFAEGGSLGAPPEILESTNERARIKLKFSEQRAQATVDIKLRNKTTGLSYGGLTSGNYTRVTLTGPNAVKSITFPDGGAVAAGSILTIQITLVRPAGSSGEVVHWQLVPSNVFAEAQGSGTNFSPTGLNRATIPSGDTLVRLQVRLNSIPGGCMQQCTGEFQTRMVNTNTDQPPYFKTARFNIIAPRQ